MNLLSFCEGRRRNNEENEQIIFCVTMEVQRQGGELCLVFFVCLCFCMMCGASWALLVACVGCQLQKMEKITACNKLEIKESMFVRQMRMQKWHKHLKKGI